MRLYIAALLFSATTASVFAQQFGPMENLGPNIPTPQSIVDRMLEAGHIKPGDTVYDLGSGDGRIVIAAAQKYGAKAVGVELMPDLCDKARDHIKELGLEDRVTIIQGSALRVDLSKADVVTMYLLTSSNERLRPNLERWLKPGARVVSNQFPIKGWKPSETIRVKAGSMEHTIYVYQMGHNK
ncbi:MAG TPA: methyltransferase domain-containing protein [Bryobacteraceae bacterium]|jgi:predicted RNA methylase|nr:methyltransferase domain-containing protein [Bryobacteraceae bacterium]